MSFKMFKKSFKDLESKLNKLDFTRDYFDQIFDENQTSCYNA